ncbi:MAG TPA: ABC transporter substrate-binding protein, partial [Coriobacteriia bacterium]|nr:ABC transporter substrate-binding protein [Coriobacteriia bacterium]
MRRRVFAVLLGIALVATVAGTGCSPQSGDRGGTGGEQEQVGTVSVMGVWGGTELESFREVATGWQDESGGTMEFEGTRDLSAILRARVQGGNPPDVAILPNPALIQPFKAQLQPLDQMLDMDQLGQDYSQDWIDQGTVDGDFVGLVIKASPKSTVWYNPRQFDQAGYETPQTWENLTTLTDTIREDGDIAPWSIGLEQGGASGWPGSDWIQEIYLGESGPEMYDQWVNHEIPWTDPSVRSAFEKFGEIATTDGNVPGGTEAILSTSPEDGSYLPFQDPPRAYMYFLGAFTQGFIEAQFEDLKPIEDYDFFDFPAVNEQYQGAATVSGDTVVVFNDNASTRSFVSYLAQGDSWQPWVEAGGFTTPNKSVDASSYQDPVAQKAAQQLTEAEPVR